MKQSETTLFDGMLTYQRFVQADELVVVLCKLDKFIADLELATCFDSDRLIVPSRSNSVQVSDATVLLLKNHRIEEPDVVALLQLLPVKQ